MSVSPEAVEAAAKQMAMNDGDLIGWILYQADAKRALEAAAPYMLAQAWEEGRRADDFEVSIGLDRNPYMLNNEGEK